MTGTILTKIKKIGAAFNAMTNPDDPIARKAIKRELVRGDTNSIAGRRIRDIKFSSDE